MLLEELKIPELVLVVELMGVDVAKVDGVSMGALVVFCINTCINKYSYTCMDYVGLYSYIYIYTHTEFWKTVPNHT